MRLGPLTGDTMERPLVSRISFLSIAILMLCGVGCIPNPDAYNMYVVEHYGSVQGERVEVDGETFAVLNKPEEGRLLVAHASKFYPIDYWRHVATTYLDRSGQACVIDRSQEITPRQIEFFYTCG